MKNDPPAGGSFFWIAPRHLAIRDIIMIPMKYSRPFSRRLLVACLYIFFCFWIYIGSATSVRASLSDNFTRIFYYREGKQARESFFAYPLSIDVFAPQMYAIDSAGSLSGSVDQKLLLFAKRNNMKVMPLVTNGSFSQSSGHTFLDDEGAEDKAIKMLIDEGVLNSYWGWQFDFEQMDVSYRDKYSEFVRRAAEALKENNMITSVAVVAQISENPDDYPKLTLWQEVIGVYDYASLASSTDFISIMAYDDPFSKGPVAPFSWIKKVIEFSLTKVSKEKLSLGVPFYYWKRSDTTGKIVDIGGWASLKATIIKYGAKPKYSAKNQAAYIEYRSNKKPYTIWYENARSIQAKLDLIIKYDLHGFSAWALGQEIPDIHRVVARPPRYLLIQ